VEKRRKNLRDINM